jgi:NADPH-dependent F420 reductase
MRCARNSASTVPSTSPSQTSASDACVIAAMPATISRAPIHRLARKIATPPTAQPAPTASSISDVTVSTAVDTTRSAASPDRLRSVRVAVIGGTGAEGFGLTLRLAAAGHEVTIGSRDAGRGAESAGRANGVLDDQPDAASARRAVAGTSNEDAAAAAELIAVTVPFAGQAEIYRSIAASAPPGTVVMDATSPLATSVGGRAWQVVRPWHGSAAEQAAAILGDRASVVAAMHTISAHVLTDLGTPVESDVFVCGDDGEAKALVGSVLEDIPSLRWVDCGALSAARISETLTALLVGVNRRYGVRDAAFRVVGRDEWGTPP